MSLLSDTKWADEVRAGRLPGVKCVMATLHEEPTSAVEVVKSGSDLTSDGPIETAFCREHFEGHYPQLVRLRPHG